VETKPQSAPMQMLPDGQLGQRVPAPDSAHIPATGFGAKFIHSASRLDSIGDCCIQYLVKQAAIRLPGSSGLSGMAKDTPFGQGTRLRVLKDYLAQAGEITEANAWEHVYRCLLWFDIGASLAHIYDSNHMQRGGTFHARAVRFTDLLCSHWNIKRNQLQQRLDVLFMGCVAELKRREAEEPAETEDTSLEEIESELTVAIKKILQDAGVEGDRALALSGQIEEMSRDFFTIGNKRQNALGEGFEDLLMLLLRRVSHIPEKNFALRKPASELPGFFKEPPPAEGEKKSRKRQPRPDIAIIDGHITPLITTAKWSIRQDRETQFQSEYSSYTRNKKQEAELRFALITNEFDLARLINVLKAKPGGDGGYIFHTVYHVSLPMLRDTHGDGFKAIEPYVQIGSLKSLSDYLAEMRGRYGEQ
jgi:hypothetical protein